MKTWLLIYHAGALGDFITICPLIAAWRKRKKPDRLVLLGRPEYGAIAVDAGLIDEIWDTTSSANLSFFVRERSAETAQRLAAFKEVLIFADQTAPIVSNIQHAAPGLRIYRQDPFPPDKMHIVKYHMKMADWPTVPETASKCLVPSEKSFREADLVAGNRTATVALHTGSGNALKNWNFKNFVALKTMLEKHGLSVIWIHGPAEKNVEYGAHATVIRSDSLAVVAAVIARCKAFIGNDSGISHLAAATGCRTLTLFGPSDPLVWGPFGENAEIFAAKTSCSPCFSAQGSRSSKSCDHACLDTISPHQVMQALLDLISK